MADTTKKASVQIVNEEQENMAVTEVETTDTNHADNVNQAPKQLIENDIALKEQMDGYGFSVVDGTLCVTYESEE